PSSTQLTPTPPHTSTLFYTLSLHDALPIYFLCHPGSLQPRRDRHAQRNFADDDQRQEHCHAGLRPAHREPCRRRKSHRGGTTAGDRKSTRLNSSHLGSSYAVFCLKIKNVIQ